MQGKFAAQTIDQQLVDANLRLSTQVGFVHLVLVDLARRQGADALGSWFFASGKVIGASIQRHSKEVLKPQKQDPDEQRQEQGQR